jgi:L,D-transpeptidase ErfK/SrfK
LKQDQGIKPVQIKSSVLDHTRLLKLLRLMGVYAFVLVAVCTCTVTVIAHAATFDLPANGNTIVGHIRVLTDTGKNTLLDIGRHYDLGYEEIVAANPGVSVWVPYQHHKIVAPTEFILPTKPWVGIVINVPQYRLYYFPKPKNGQTPQVITFPLSIFRPGWPTPLGSTRIIAKHRDPSWFVPKSIQEEHRKNGESQFPSYFPPGPDNPMGMLAMETGFPAIFIHGTNQPWGVGMRTSHGCFHLYPEDAAQLFQALAVGTPVRIINEPYVVGLRDGRLYMAAFKPLADYPTTLSPLTRAVAAVTRMLPGKPADAWRPAVDWEQVRLVAEAQGPVPVVISPGGPKLHEVIAGIKPEVYHYQPYGSDANGGLLPTAAR